MKYDMNSMKRLLCLVCCFYWLSVIVYGSKKTSSFYLAELKCENLIEPLGIDNVTPHFSWKLKGDGWKGGQTSQRSSRTQNKQESDIAYSKVGLWDCYT